MPRHRAEARDVGFDAGFRALGILAYAGSRVSASVVDLDSRQSLVAIDDRVSMPTGGLGRLLLLIEVSARITADEAFGGFLIGRSPQDQAGGSGLWQYLLARGLTVADLASLVGSAGDNLAANALLRVVGLEAVHARAESLGLGGTALLDRARDSRGPDDAPQQSVGAMSELAGLMLGLARAELVDPLTSSRVLGWLSLDADLSLASSAFGLAPLAHRGPVHGLQFVNATGHDAGVLAEAGVLRGPRHGLAFAVSVHYADSSLAARLRVLDALRVFGLDLLEYAH